MDEGMPPVRVIDANEANMPMFGRRTIAEFDAAFAAWQQRHGQEMPKAMLNRKAKRKRAKRRMK